MSKFTRFLRGFLPVSFMDEAAKVPAEIQAKIDKITQAAATEVAQLKATHSVAAVQTRADDDVKAVQDTAAHHIALIREKAARDANDAKALLPSVASQFGLTGATGPSGP